MIIAALGGDSPDMCNGEKAKGSYGGSEGELERAQLLGELPAMIQTRSHCFVHAGCRPRYSLEQRQMMFCNGFAAWEFENHNFNEHIVYGHAPSKEPLLLRHGSGLDTGACYGGPLTFGEFRADRSTGPVEFLRAT